MVRKMVGEGERRRRGGGGRGLSGGEEREMERVGKQERMGGEEGNKVGEDRQKNKQQEKGS